MTMDKKALVVKYRGLVSLACRLYNLPNLFRRRIKGTGNRIEASCALMKRVNVRMDYGFGRSTSGFLLSINEAF